MPEVLIDTVGDMELRVLRPAVIALGQPDFLLAERFPVSRRGVLFIGRPIGNVAIHDDQSRTVRCFLEGAESPLQHLQVIGIADPGHVPAIGDEPRGNILRERQRGVAFDRDVVVVVDPA